MVFTSSVFLLVFFPVVLIGYYFPFLSKSRKYKNYFLLMASLIFYAWGEPTFVLLMVFSIFITWGLGLLIEAKNYKKVILFIGIAYHLSILFIFKYLTFLGHEVIEIPQLPNIALPIGISFFTFQMMSYLFDVYGGRVDAQNNILYLGLYVSLFPQLIAGPIVRYSTIEKEIGDRNESFNGFIDGIERFILGMGKKALLADFLAVIANSAFDFSRIDEMGMLTAWLGAVAYMLQIYFDFSGYSDMAIGLGLCFGFYFNENFNYPYLADSINDFWKRWHISLTDWFRDYIYIPMGGNQVSIARHIFNIMMIWLLTGIWHGANWTFLLWGGVFMDCCSLQKNIFITRLNGLLCYLAHIRCFVFVFYG